MIEAEVTVVVDGQAHEFKKFGLGDLVAMEREYNVSSGEFATNLKIEWVAFLVHRKLVRGGLIEPCAFDDDFLDRVESIDFGGDEDESEAADPTEPEALTA